MDKKKIQGIYNIIADLSGCFTTITIANNNRDRGINATNGNTLNFKLISSAEVSTYVKFLQKNILRIKRARLLTVGAEGLRTALNSTVAANITLKPRAVTGETGTSSKYIGLNFPRFNEWTQFNINFETWKDSTITGAAIDLGLISQVTDIHFDDFNIQKEYEGEPIKLHLEMEIDTAGVLIDNGEIV